MKSTTYHLLTLGCAKNDVDSVSMAQLLNQAGYRMVLSADEASVVIVNTCGFIQAARDEAYAVLREMAANKQPGQMLLAAGCLPQRVGMQVASQVPGVDGILGTRNWMDVVDVVRELRKGPHPEPLYHLPDTPTVQQGEGVLRASITGSSAYIKIADGCRRPCAFCSIPLIKGTAVSRPPAVIVEEARLLVESRMRELVLIAQDTTDYGHDLGMQEGLASLVEQICRSVPGLDWLRIQIL